MTDEELAEEWIKEHSGLIGSYKFVKYDYDSLKQAFLAGLRAKTQWHDLRQNPDDLPESSVFHEVLNQNGTKVFYDDVFKKWNMYCGGIVQAQTPIAWCEIPKFKE